MKRHQTVAFLIALFLLATAACSSHTSTAPLPPDSIEFEPVDYITIQGRQYSTSLTELQLIGSEFTDADIEPLRYMTNLEILYLYQTNVSDISSLAQLTNLTDLQLSFNRIADVSPLARMTNLTNLYLKGNNVTDVSPLADMISLTNLDLSYNRFDDKITDITPLSKLINLTVLVLDSNTIVDYSPLTELPNLRTLCLSYNGITDITQVTEFVNLSSLSSLQLDGNQISDISTLSGLNKSAYLTLTDNPIADWSPVAHVEVVLGRPLSAASAVNIVMNGSSMLPTITDGEKLTVKRINDYTPNNGDIIAFTKQDVTDEPLVRRVIAIARETVDINFDSSLVYVDGITLDEPYINEPIREIGQTIQFPAIIPDEYCFVMGDNRNHSLDSRNPSVGFVAVNEIIGIASAAT